MQDHAPISLPQFTTPSSESQLKNSERTVSSTAIDWIGSACETRGLYIHIPFCFHKCHYCDFFSIVASEDQFEPFVERLIEEIQSVGHFLTQEFKTIFIGGGTPTLLPDDLLEQLFTAINDNISLADQYEWTIEANPETLTSQKANVIANGGVNRVSIGAQSFEPALLKQLERWHDPENVHRAMSMFRNAGINNINLDLIHSIPTQTMEQLHRDLEVVVSLSPEHLSCYSLIYEPNTPLRTRLERGEVTRLCEDVEIQMFEEVTSTLVNAGYAQYEISNYSKEGYQCKHNIVYWENRNWWPIGPSASGHIKGRRWRNKPRLSEYVSSAGLPPIDQVESLGIDQQLGETCMLGLRMTDGLKRSTVNQIIEGSIEQWRGPVINQFIQEGMLHWKNECLALTRKGVLLADSVIVALLMDDRRRGR